LENGRDYISKITCSDGFETVFVWGAPTVCDPRQRSPKLTQIPVPSIEAKS
jgi:hypothetical protein